MEVVSKEKRTQITQIYKKHKLLLSREMQILNKTGFVKICVICVQKNTYDTAPESIFRNLHLFYIQFIQESGKPTRCDRPNQAARTHGILRVQIRVWPRRRRTTRQYKTHRRLPANTMRLYNY